MSKNKLIIAAAGSGKTTYLVNEALKINEGNVLITTFTEANEEEIKRKLHAKMKYQPKNIQVQTWFSFLIEHGVKPYQGGIFDKKIKGLVLTNQPSVPFIPASNTARHYFTKESRIYSDKLSKFVVKSNALSNGDVIDRISRIYKNIFIDEVQDLAGYDLDFLKLLFASRSRIQLVGDIRQVTYLTHHENKYSRYRNGNLENFVLEECEVSVCEIDKTTLNKSHRNCKLLCDFSSELYPHLARTAPCECTDCRVEPEDHEGIFLVKLEHLEIYRQKYNPVELFSQKAVFPAMNYGASKGLGFDRVLIHPTQPILKYLKDSQLFKTVSVRGRAENKPAFDIAKFYVAVTRAKYSAAILCDYGAENYIEGVQKFIPE